MHTTERRLGVVEILSLELEVAGRTIRVFRQLLTDYLDGVGEIQLPAQEVDRLEDEADRLQRRLELELLQKETPSQWEADCIHLANAIEKIANQVEDASEFLVLTRPEIPGFLAEPLLLINNATVAAYESLAEGWDDFRNAPARLLDATHRVDDHEHSIDRILWDATRQIFSSGLGLAEKMHLKSFFDQVERISNRLEDAAHALEALAVREKNREARKGS
ncbi:MAG: DUF47 family protein [Planctomycetes bacterium]|nr:DUF47 family protein [Planctomycetota bacterium]